jgi:iron complex transport system ATP-binding protein
MSILKLRSVSVSLPDSKVNAKPLLSAMSFSVEKGEIVGIVGPNGAGKSTLLKAIAGVFPTVSGEIQLQGDDLAHLTTIERACRVSYLPQHCEVSFPYKVLDVLKLAFYSDSTSNNQQQLTRINEALDALGITELRERNINELSGGQQQLVHLARTVIQNCPLMLLDEPSSSLDLSHESRFYSHLIQLRNFGYSTLLAIHDLNTASRLCDKIALIANGNLCVFGIPQKVLSRENLHKIYGERVEVYTDSLGGLRIEAKLN